MALRQRESAGFQRIRLFKLFGFEVKPDLSWLLLALLISWSLGAGLFPQAYPGFSIIVYAWMGIAAAIGVFFSIVFHEFSHSLVARHVDTPIRGNTLFIFGGVADTMAVINLTVALFNLVPAFPLDGGRMYRNGTASGIPSRRRKSATHARQ